MDESITDPELLKWELWKVAKKTKQIPKSAAMKEYVLGDGDFKYLRARQTRKKPRGIQAATTVARHYDVKDIQMRAVALWGSLFYLAHERTKRLKKVRERKIGGGNKKEARKKPPPPPRQLRAQRGTKRKQLEDEAESEQAANDTAAKPQKAKAQERPKRTRTKK